MTIVELRARTSALLEDLGNYQMGIGAPVIQELILAQRHLEDARMRLGVAMALEKGQNPWADSERSE